MFNRTMRAAFKNIAPTVVEMNFRGSFLKFLQVLQHIPFPCLSSFKTGRKLDRDLAQFITAHASHITTLSIGQEISLPPVSRPVRGYHREMHIAMPTLVSFEGPFSSLPIFIPGSTTTKVCINTSSVWRQERVEERLVNTLSSSLVPITSLTFEEFRYKPVIFDLIGQKLTHLTEMSFTYTPFDFWVGGHVRVGS